MKMNEYGVENKKNILLIHGAGTSDRMWKIQIESLSNLYHIFAPTLNGHAIGECQDYVSPEREAEGILEWFTNKNITKIDLICGASLGADIVAEIIIQNPCFADYAFIESLKSYQYGKIMTKIFCTLGKKLLRRAASVSGLMEGSYEKEYVSDDMKYVLSNMTTISMHNVLLSASNYEVPIGNAEILTKTLIVYGSKEKKLCQANTIRLSNQIKNCQCMVLEGYNHGELSIGYPLKHIEMITNLLSNK